MQVLFRFPNHKDFASSANRKGLRQADLMANTFTQIYVHVIFAVEGKQSLIEVRDNKRLQKYITGIVTRLISNRRVRCQQPA